MGDLPVSTLAFLLVSAVFLSAFFSGTETALMSVNRYRLRHLAREGSRSARIAEKQTIRPVKGVVVPETGTAQKADETEA